MTLLGSDAQARPVVVLISATWAGPSRPAPTVLRELQKRWGASADAVLIEDPDDTVIDALRIDVVPTWLRLEPAPRGAIPDSATPLDKDAPAPRSSPTYGAEHSEPTTTVGGGVAPRATAMELGLEGVSPHGATVMLSGRWVETHRRTGAVPKHLIDQEFGPAAGNAV